MVRFTRRLPGMLSLCLAVLVGLSPVAAKAQDLVPPGNRNASQPAVPGGSHSRTRQLRTTFDTKYQRIYDLLKRDKDLRTKIVAVSRRYSIDPVHIAGALVGEHTYNVDALDRLQTYYVKATSYLQSGLTFAYKGESLTDFLSREQFRACDASRSDEALWNCRETVFEANFRGRTVDGRSYPNQRFGATFFQPYYAGQTFGLGQLNPLTALSVSDVVHRVSGYPELNPADAAGVYAAIMDPDKTLAYMAAVIRSSITAYRNIAGFDISKNPGIVATLYNLGNPAARASTLARDNRQRAAARQPKRLPQENYYGWLVNDKEDELRALFR
ncbi:DUF1402 family protein [Aureimonas altamirensis]|uniref:DUF1402 family protein n=2 Tax=Aureimonas altamirensis TaxID=370622 RepID=A0A0P0YVJ5_9HYPH|nr:hypothetical protein [Aureimonas altamirensis]SHJ97267.1 Protein of unknown function [Aureimonas altamirensis DSM 21988]